MDAKTSDVELYIQELLGGAKTVEILGSGVLGNCYRVDGSEQRLFLKEAPLDQLPMFEMEFKGLQNISQTATLRVPEPVRYGSAGQHAYLALDYLELQPHHSASLQRMGTQLARMHLTRTPWSFGFEADNSVGASLQPNKWAKDWQSFFRDQRLSYQVARIEEELEDTELCSGAWELLEDLDPFFNGCEIRPSLLHGDLWRGNSARLSDDSPVCYDPSCYFGHHEAELSIMHMFGGYGPEFFEAYHALIPQADGFAERQLLYQLYHYLNHYYLFGKSYRQACIDLIDKALQM